MHVKKTPNKIDLNLNLNLSRIDFELSNEVSQFFNPPPLCSSMKLTRDKSED